MNPNNQNNQSETPKNETPSEITLPVEFVAHAPSMRPLALSMAVQIGAKHPAIVQAAVEFRDSYSKAGEKFFSLAQALRSAKLLKKEQTLLLLGLGLSKSRASEISKLSNVSEAIWSKYSVGSIGFRVALQDGKLKETTVVSGDSVGEAGGNEESSTGGTSKPEPKPVVKILDVPDVVKAMLRDVVKAWKNPLKKGKTEYAFAVNVGNHNFYFAITADKKQ